MWKNINLAQCLSHINNPAAAKNENRPPVRPAITISRMCGSGGRTVASKLAEYLQLHTPPGRPWTIFDKNLIEKVLEDHHLSKRLAEYLPEDRKPLLAALMEKLRGLDLPAPAMVEQTAETVWHLAEGGHVILVGRGAAVITEKMANVFRVRLVGSLEKRIARIEEVYEMGRSDAREFVQSQDAAKRHYLKAYFGREIDDPLLYDLTINTDDISYADAARLIGDTVISRFKLAPSAG